MWVSRPCRKESMAEGSQTDEHERGRERERETARHSHTETGITAKEWKSPDGLRAYGGVV